MSTNKIIIASVLKPLKDARAYYRFGLSLRETNKYQINIIGFSLKKEVDEKNISFYSIFSEKRNHFSRYLSGWRLIRHIKKIKPKISIICSWELLPAAVIGKIIFGGKLIYDVQENTIANIRHNRTMPTWKKPLAKCLVAFTETWTKPFISYFLFAEHCYLHELPSFTPNLILENKYYGDFVSKRKAIQLSKEQINFLISGTLTEVYGIMDAINWFKAIQETYPGFNLRIIGHCPLPSFKQEIIKASEGRKNIDLLISDTPIAYSDIQEAYTKSDVILMPYHQIPSIQDKIPSKLYESLAMGKPCLFNPNSNWNSLVKKYGAGMEMEFRDPDSAAANLSRFLESSHFRTLPGDEVLWKSDEKKFLDLIEKLM
jgi:glycosyltransferase involved in cell wall biosynthesis